MIENGGSQVAIGYRIEIDTNGVASYVTGDGADKAAIPGNLDAQLRADIEAARPLFKLPTSIDCTNPINSAIDMTKSSTRITFNGERSPDISCSSEARGQKLFDDVKQIVSALKLREVPHDQGKELSSPGWF